ncbi:MAG: hypothetical protein U1D68_15285 [Arthrobacter sp.]|nr:hypothetical protein [Arthrobacter sp.]MDZ4353984.1 hypothetical protein [Arthrobacter sp.]
MDLSTAKQSTRAQQDELLSVVPSMAVSTTKQAETSRALFECEAAAYYWPGTLDIVLSEDADGDRE